MQRKNEIRERVFVRVREFVRDNLSRPKAERIRCLNMATLGKQIRNTRFFFGVIEQVVDSMRC